VNKQSDIYAGSWNRNFCLIRVLSTQRLDFGFWVIDGNGKAISLCSLAYTLTIHCYSEPSLEKTPCSSITLFVWKKCIHKLKVYSYKFHYSSYLHYTFRFKYLSAEPLLALDCSCDWLLRKCRVFYVINTTCTVPPLSLIAVTLFQNNSRLSSCVRSDRTLPPDSPCNTPLPSCGDGCHLSPPPGSYPPSPSSFCKIIFPFSYVMRRGLLFKENTVNSHENGYRWVSRKIKLY